MSRPVALLTDFGPGSVYVGQMHAALRRRIPDLVVLDLAHDAPAADVEAAAYLLETSLAFLPDDCVTIVVVDPGVGTERDILAAQVGDASFVGPDNGVLARSVSAGRVRRIEDGTDERWLGEHVSATFHGRDVMAPVAAYLARGGGLEALGPAATPTGLRTGPQRVGDGLQGRVLLVDGFGNLVTNVSATMLAAISRPQVEIGSRVIDGLERTFGDVDTGSLLAYIGSGGHVEIAVNGGRASDVLRIGAGAPVRLEPRA